MRSHSNKNNTYQTHFLAPAAALAIVVALSVWALSKPTLQAGFVNDPVFFRELVAYEILPTGEEAEPLVKYEYLGEPLPEKLAPDEDVTKRTETSYHRVVQPETEDTPATYQGIFYSQPTFAREGNEWRYIEHATTTKAAFDALRAESPLATLFLRKAQAQSISPFAGSGDGFVQMNTNDTSEGCVGFNTVWADAHGAAAGTGNQEAGTTLSAGTSTGFIDNELPFPDSCSASINRGFLPFNTASIPASASITAVTLNLYATVLSDEGGGAEVIVVETSQATHTALENTDYDQVGSAEGGRKTIGSMTTSAYNAITFDATGRSFINYGGGASTCSATANITCIGIIDSYDFNNIEPYDISTLATVSASEATGTSQDPYLSVTYTTRNNAFWMWSDF